MVYVPCASSRAHMFDLLMCYLWLLVYYYMAMLNALACAAWGQVAHLHVKRVVASAENCGKQEPQTASFGAYGGRGGGEGIRASLDDLLAPPFRIGAAFGMILLAKRDVQGYRVDLDKSRQALASRKVTGWLRLYGERDMVCDLAVECRVTAGSALGPLGILHGSKKSVTICCKS